MMSIYNQNNGTGFFHKVKVLFLLILIAGGCADRKNTPFTAADSTITYAPKNADDVSAVITLYRYEDEKSKFKIGKANRFYIGEDAYVRAQVDLSNLFLKTSRSQMFHVEWVDNAGHSFYMKQEELKPEDSVAFLYSSISATPGREPGNYALKVYYFRELIAEKYFELIPDSLEKPGAVEGVTGTITLCTKVNRKTGKRSGIDSVFVIGKRSYIRAFVDLENRFANADLVLDFTIEWIGPDKQPFYTKEIQLNPDDSSTSLYSSVSITPNKRVPGEYALKVRLFDELLAVQKFEIKDE